MSNLAALLERIFYKAIRWCLRNQRTAIIAVLLAVMVPLGTLTLVEYNAMKKFEQDSSRTTTEQLQYILNRLVLEVHDKLIEQGQFLFHIQDREHTELLKKNPAVRIKLVNAIQNELNLSCKHSSEKVCEHPYAFMLYPKAQDRWLPLMAENIAQPGLLRAIRRSEQRFWQLKADEQDVGMLFIYDTQEDVLLMMHPVSSKKIYSLQKIGPPRPIEVIMGLAFPKKAFDKQTWESLLRRSPTNRFESNPMNQMMVKSSFHFQVRDEKGAVLASDIPNWEQLTRDRNYLSASVILTPEQKFLTGWQFSVMTKNNLRQIMDLNLGQMITMGTMVACLLSGLLVIMLKAGMVAVKVSDMRADIVAGVSHDLKTPLAGIIASAQLLASGRAAGPEETREFSGYIVTEAERLTGVVEKVLTLAKLESSQLKMKPAPIAVPDLVEHAIKSIRCAFPDAIILKGGIPQGEIYGDFQALTTVLVNLMDNAIRYSQDQAWVKVQAFWSQRGEYRTLHVQIEDRGVGIAADEQPYIFQKFYRVRKGLVADTEGTGLGLAIASQIVLAHQGYIQVESEVGVGSKFIVRIPCAHTSR